MKKIIAISTLLLLSACSTFTPQRYSISANNNVAIKSLGKVSVKVAQFKRSAQYDNTCRAVGPIAPPDGLSVENYIHNAFVSELELASAYNSAAPVELTGDVENLSFSSSKGLFGGTWDITLALKSSNGRVMKTSEHYEFKSGFTGETACKQTAEALMPAVQDLIGKVVRSPEFPTLLQTK